VRGGIIATLVFASLLVAATPAGAGSKQSAGDVQSMTVTASSHAASAHPVRLSVTLSYRMQCNYPGAGPVVITFPKALRMPRHLAAGAVQLAGKPIAANVNGRRVTVTIKPHSGVLCGMVGPGMLRLVFTRKAHLANPTRPGSYRFTAAHTTHTFTAELAIKAG
jgi:hypothetical protein